jgi:hypothetical protein
MALIIADRIKETSTTTGTGSLTLSGATTGFRSFASACSVNDTFYYAIQSVDSSGNPTAEWEVGKGTYSAANTLARTTVLSSSNSNAAVSFSAGTKQVWIDLAASQLSTIANGTFAALKIGTYISTTEVGGDLYTAINAYHDGSNWQRVDTAKVAWLYQYNMANNMLYESYKAHTVWTVQPGANPIGAFTSIGGWLMVQSYSEFKDVTYGGNGFEIDGNGTTPYGRLRHTTIGGTHVTEIAQNTFLDDAGRDDTAVQSWAAGLYGDAFKIRRAPSGATLTWNEYFTVLANGCALINRTADFNSTALQVGGSVSAIAAGAGFRVLEGTNCKQGTATLAAGTVTVNNTSVTANSRIFLTAQSTGGTPGALRISARTAGTSFTITSTSGTDTSVVAYQIFEPA